MTSTQPWILRPDSPKRSRHVPPDVEYHRVYAGEKRRIPRGILAIVLLFAGLVIFPSGLRAVADAVDGALGRTGETPLTVLSGMAGLALLIPWSMLIQRLLYGVPFGSLHSVTGRFRFLVFGKAMLVFGPLWILVIGVLNFLPGAPEVPWTTADLAAVLLITLLVTPLQAAGEEYGVRGLMFRVFGSWTRGATAGLVLGVIATSVIFTLVHGTNDPLIIAWYMVLWSGLAIITWRTGGIEIAIVLHALVNTVSFLSATMLRTDISIQDRSAGTGHPSLLAWMAVIIVATALVWWQTRQSGPERTPIDYPGDGAGEGAIGTPEVPMVAGRADEKNERWSRAVP